jgi:hypothetical protein
MNSLVLELVEAIIGHVGESSADRSHLLACSLVCRLWFPLSQSRLLYHIKFRKWPIGELNAEIQALDQVLLKWPHLASYIRVLELPNMSKSDPRMRSRITIHKLSQLLCKFTQVQQIRISGLPWNVMPGDLKQSLCRVLKLPSMAFVHISGSQFVSMDDFADLLNHARDSTGLSLDYISTLCLPRRPLETKHGEDNKQTLERHHISHPEYKNKFRIC